MRKVFFTILFFTFWVQSLFGQSVAKEEYEIYEFILKKIYQERIKNEPKLNFVILDETMSPNKSQKEEPKETSNSDANQEDIEFRKQVTEVLTDYNTKLEEAKTSDDFSRKFKIPFILQPQISADFPYLLVRKNRVDGLLKSGKRDFETAKRKGKVGFGSGIIIWKYFNKKYPNSNGYYQFSRVGFSQDKKFAQVTIEGRGAEWSSSDFYVLKKEENGWTIYTQFGYLVQS